MKIELNMDEKSGKITNISINGDLNAASVDQAMLYVKKVFGQGVQGVQQPSVMAKDLADLSAGNLTIKERLKLFLKFEYHDQWFNTIEVKERYESQYNEIKISTVSTYLSRLHGEGFLERRGNKVEREYRIAASGPAPGEASVQQPQPQSR
jgi:hypothetical protein